MTAPLRNALQTYQTILYDRVLHPEWFRLAGRRAVHHRAYELEAWLTPGGHVLRFDHNERRVCELVTDQEDNLPDTGVLMAFPCSCEAEVEEDLEELGIRYMTSTAIETLTHNLYLTTMDEMRRHVLENKSLHHAWACEDGPCLSVLDIDPHSKEVHVDAYHLVAQQGLVVRTQTIFEHM